MLFFKEVIRCDREVQELHQAPQRILQLLLALMVEVFERIRIDNPFPLLQATVEEEYMPVLLVHHLLLIVGLSISNKQLLKNG